MHSSAAATAEDFDLPESLVDRLTRMIRDDIASGRIRPGEKVTEIALAERLGISRNPIREAVRRLEGAGLLINHPRRGRFVREISRDEADDIFFFRLSVERAVIRRVAACRSAADVAHLDGLLTAMRKAARIRDIARTMELDLAFHRAICEIAQSRRALSAFDDIHVELRILLRMAGDAFSTLEQTVASHEVLLAAIAAGDGQQADAAMERHIGDAHAEISAYFNSTEHRPPP